MMALLHNLLLTPCQLVCILLCSRSKNWTVETPFSQHEGGKTQAAMEQFDRSISAGGKSFMRERKSWRVF